MIKKTNKKKHVGRTFSPPSGSGSPLNNRQLRFKSRPAPSLKFQLPFCKTGSNKRFTHQTLWKKKI